MTVLDSPQGLRLSLDSPAREPMAQGLTTAGIWIENYVTTLWTYLPNGTQCAHMFMRSVAVVIKRVQGGGNSMI